MTTTTLPTAHSQHRARSGRLSFPRVVRSEWIKLRSLRSTVWCYILVVIVSLGLAALMGSTASFGAQLSEEQQLKIAVQASTFGVFFGQLIVAVLGVLVLSGEYSTGMIRSTLTAIPRRLPALWAKALVLAVSSFVVGLVSTVGAYAVSTPFLAAQGVDSGSLIDSRVWLSLVGASFYLAVVSVFALGLAAILRNSAGGIAAALGLILLLPIVFMIAPLTWMHDTLPYLIMNAGLASFGLNAFGGPSRLETWQQFLVIIVWALVTLIGGAVLLKWRDA